LLLFFQKKKFLLAFLPSPQSCRSLNSRLSTAEASSGTEDHKGRTILHSHTFRRVAALTALCLTSGCGLGHQLLGLNGTAATNPTLGQTTAATSVFGYAVADEPQAALVARQILDDGGNAADAAAAEGFALSVTLPSRASLGGGGACIVKMPDAQGNAQRPVALLFPPGKPTSSGGSRPAAVPTLARGLLALQARYGQMPYASVIVPAERLAGSAPVSPALESDLQVVGNALLADPAAAAVFAPSGTLLPAGANLVQPDLAATFETLRTQGVQGFYSGAFAQQFTNAADIAGGGLTVQDMNEATPRFVTPDTSSTNGFDIATLPTAAAATNQTLPATAAFAALDKNGGVVACAVTMNNLFGTGRIAPGTGILLAAAPGTHPVPELAAGVAYRPGTLTFRAAATGTGQQGAALAVASALASALAGNAHPIVPEPGRANLITCPGGVPGGEGTCSAAADPRGQGLAIGGR
jgi:gamma-glutamyltranspeptidase / glutathione hydrolase